jgi:hypothetical protein
MNPGEFLGTTCLVEQCLVLTFTKFNLIILTFRKPHSP